jgi:hypothetical protein
VERRYSALFPLLWSALCRKLGSAMWWLARTVECFLDQRGGEHYPASRILGLLARDQSQSSPRFRTMARYSERRRLQIDLHCQGLYLDRSEQRQAYVLSFIIPRRGADLKNVGAEIPCPRPQIRSPRNSARIRVPATAARTADSGIASLYTGPYPTPALSLFRGTSMG